MPRDAGEWRPLGDQDSEEGGEKAAAIRAAARVPGASTSTCSAVRAVAGNIKGGTASHVTRMFAVRGGAFALGGATSRHRLSRPEACACPATPPQKNCFYP